MERRNSRKGVLDMVGGAAMYLLLQAGRKKKRESRADGLHAEINLASVSS